MFKIVGIDRHGKRWPVVGFNGRDPMVLVPDDAVADHHIPGQILVAPVVIKRYVLAEYVELSDHITDASATLEAAKKQADDVKRRR